MNLYVNVSLPQKTLYYVLFVNTIKNSKAYEFYKE